MVELECLGVRQEDGGLVPGPHSPAPRMGPTQPEVNPGRKTCSTMFSALGPIALTLSLPRTNCEVRTVKRVSSRQHSMAAAGRSGVELSAD